MPSLFRLLVFCVVIAALFYGGMFALVTFVKPKEREITVSVPVAPAETSQAGTDQVPAAQDSNPNAQGQ